MNTQRTNQPDAKASQVLSQRYPPYPEYKDSGVEWLARVPGHWPVAPVYSHYEVALGKMLDAKRISGENLAPYLRNIDVQWDRVNIHDLPHMDFSASERVRYSLRPGDVLVCEGGEVGRSAVWRGALEECFYQKALHRVRPRTAGDEPRFFFFLMQAAATRGAFTAGTNPNTIDHLTAVQLRHYRFPFPPLPEQRTIATFLDRETGKIDALIAKKERLIELLEEKRTAMITHAVTKGLDPDVPMKDSGVEWLGEIPAHWIRRKIAYIARMVSGSTPDKSIAEYWQGEIPWISPKDMKTRIIIDSIDHISEAALHESSLTLVMPPAVLIVVRGMILAHTFPVAYTLVPVTINQDMKALRLDEDFDVNYFVYLLEGWRPRVLSLIEDAAHGTKRLRTDLWRSLEIYLPDRAEQAQIARILDAKAAYYGDLITKIHQAITHLKEYRTALISAAVTGKIDVREHA